MPCSHYSSTTLDQRSLLDRTSVFEKKQAIDNATKVASFGTLYWTHFEAGAAERAEILLRPGRISAVICSLGTDVLQVPPSDRHAAWPIGTLLPADPQLTNWSFTWPRFQGGFPHFPRVPPFSSICKREAGFHRGNRRA